MSKAATAVRAGGLAPAMTPHGRLMIVDDEGGAPVQGWAAVLAAAAPVVRDG